LIDLKNHRDIDRLNFYFKPHRGRGTQLFSLWAIDEYPEISGDPAKNGWKYLGAFFGGNQFGSNGISIAPEDLKCWFLLVVTDGHWHSNDYFDQVDLFVK
jgi:hypothetical protein